jgi:hypothetical protein
MKRKHVEHEDDDQLASAACKVVRTARLWTSEKILLLSAEKAVQRADEAVLRADKQCRDAQVAWVNARDARNVLRMEAADAQARVLITLQAYEAARAERRVEASYARAAPEKQVQCFMYFKYFVCRH